jgi:hypothetical protein
MRMQILIGNTVENQGSGSGSAWIRGKFELLDLDPDPHFKNDPQK